MKIRHEMPSSELDWKVQAPLMLETPSGEVVRIESWSLAGLEWPQDQADRPATGVLSVPFQGVDIRFPVRLKAGSETGHMHFEGLSGRQREVLSIFYHSILSGRMAGSEDIITSLDTPVDLVPMSETEEEKSAGSTKKISRPFRIFFHVASYVLLACVVLGILATSAFRIATRIDIPHGRVVAPIATSLPASEGFVQSVSVEPGETVVAGQILVRLRDPKLQAELAEARAHLVLAEKDLERVQDAIAALTDLQTVTPLETRGALAAQIYAQMIGDRGFETLWDRWILLVEAENPAAASLDPFSFAFEKLRELEAVRMTRVRTLRAARDGHKNAINYSHVRAPEDGVVHEILVRKGQPYGPDDLAVVFEGAAPRVAVGWVSERFAEKIFIGMPAQIGVNSAGKRLKVEGEVTNVTAGHDPKRPGEFGIIVTVAPSDMSATETKHLLRLDAPVSLETRSLAVERILNLLSKSDPLNEQ